MLASDEEFREVRNPRKHKMSSLVAAAAEPTRTATSQSTAPHAPRLSSSLAAARSQRAGPTTINRFSSLSRAASESSGESVYNDADEEEIDFTEDDDMSVESSVEATADKVKQLSLQKSKPGAQVDGPGRKE